MVCISHYSHYSLVFICVLPWPRSILRTILFLVKQSGPAVFMRTLLYRLFVYKRNKYKSILYSIQSSCLSMASETCFKWERVYCLLVVKCGIVDFIFIIIINDVFFLYLQGGCTGSSCGGCDCSGVKGLKVRFYFMVSKHVRADFSACFL